jgi:hypothetical protein
MEEKLSRRNSATVLEAGTSGAAFIPYSPDEQYARRP